MFHEPSKSVAVDRALAYKGRVGLRMFLLYAVVYGGFVIINIVSPLVMERTVFLGLNLAVVYGFGLIGFAFVLALLYTRVCARQERSPGACDDEAEA